MDFKFEKNVGQKMILELSFFLLNLKNDFYLSVQRSSDDSAKI